MQTILVTDNPQYWLFLKSKAAIIEANDYLLNEDYLKNTSIRVMNLCTSYHYQTIGYYVSLLAQARDHRAIPSALHLQDALTASLTKQISQDIEEEIQHSLRDIHSNEFILSVYFGQNMAKRHVDLARKLHGLFPLPLMRFVLERKKQWVIKKLLPISPADIPEHHIQFMQEAAECYFSKQRFHHWKKKQRLHDLAILYDPNERNAPSDRRAIDLFVDAGEAAGMNVDVIDKNDSKFIAEYDALFIRATTALDHYTYRLARRAAQENLVVIDDPQSIVKCTNKVYLAELMRMHQILTPETLFISKFDTTLPHIEFPCVLKKPDSAFSHGVIKLHDGKELQKSLNQFFKTSDLILIQPFIPTEYDWRIGIIDNKPLFACRYYMAKDHWQIYNWNSTEEREGNFDTLPLNEVPEGVIKTALKATRLIGNSLYGVDIKSDGEKHYVIEVNDNPNIDFGIEDQVLGETLYHQIMAVFLQRIRRKHGYA
jgi:glutathione synthase/RimK-type ligase-like ATP-grasp enzyme